MGMRKGRKYNAVSEEQVEAIKKLYADGASGTVIGKQFGICTETALKIARDQWRPRKVKLPWSDNELYMDYLLLGSFGAVARKYAVTPKAVMKRLHPYMESIKAKPQYLAPPRKLPESDRVVFYDWLDLGTYVAVGKKYGTAPKTARVRIQKIIESGKSEGYRADWLEEDPFGR